MRRTLDNLPEIAYNYFTLNGIKYYTGTLLSKPAENTFGITSHFAFFYATDKKGIKWLVHLDFDGTGVIELDDFIDIDKSMPETQAKWDLRYGKLQDIEITINIDPSKTKEIINRAVEQKDRKFHPTASNCESYARYCVYGEKDIGSQAMLFELAANLFTIPFDSNVILSGDKTAKKRWFLSKKKAMRPPKTYKLAFKPPVKNK